MQSSDYSCPIFRGVGDAVGREQIWGRSGTIGCGREAAMLRTAEVNTQSRRYLRPRSTLRGCGRRRRNIRPKAQRCTVPLGQIVVKRWAADIPAKDPSTLQHGARRSAGLCEGGARAEAARGFFASVYEVGWARPAARPLIATHDPGAPP